MPVGSPKKKASAKAAEKAKEDVLSAAELEEEARLLEDFRRFDQNGDGIITREELSRVFQDVDPVYWNESRLGKLMDEVDTNGDGLIYYEEFIAWLRMSTDGCSSPSGASGATVVQMRSRKSLEQANLIADCRSVAGVTDQFFVELIQERHHKIGLQVDKSDTRRLPIKKILDGGLFARWNAGNPRLQVMQGDMITSVNGVHSCSHDMMHELHATPFKGSRTLKIALQPKASAYRYVNRLEDSFEMDRGLVDEDPRFSIRNAVNRVSKQQVMVKSYKKNGPLTPRVCDVEITALKRLDHPNIAKLFEVFEDFLAVHLVLERCTGGELLERVIEEERFRERDAAIIMQQLFGAIAHLQNRRVCHRDVRPENVLMLERCPIENCTIKLTGFAFARAYEVGGTFSTIVGQSMFRSPQVNQSYYDRSCDMWSCGIVLYMLISGYPPFSGDTDYAIVREVERCELPFPRSDFAGISEDCINLIAGLITKDTRLRYTVDRCLSHPFTSTRVAKVADISLVSGQKRLKEYGRQSVFKKAALQAAALRLRPSEVDELRHMFRLLDKNGDSTITLYEMNEGFNRLGKPELIADLANVLQRVDMDGNQRIDYTEFLAATLDQRHFHDESACWAAFRVFDRDNSGMITLKELEQVLRTDEVQNALGSDAAEAALKEFDLNGDGSIDFHEFTAMLRKQESHIEEL